MGISVVPDRNQDSDFPVFIFWEGRKNPQLETIKDARSFAKNSRNSRVDWHKIVP